MDDLEFLYYPLFALPIMVLPYLQWTLLGILAVGLPSRVASQQSSVVCLPQFGWVRPFSFATISECAGLICYTNSLRWSIARVKTLVLSVPMCNRSVSMASVLITHVL